MSYPIKTGLGLGLGLSVTGTSMGVTTADIISRYFRTNDSSSAYETGQTLIANPEVFFDIEFDLFPGSVPGTYISQNVNSGSSSRGFQIYSSSSTFEIYISGGGSSFESVVSEGFWRFKFDGNEISLFKDGVLVEVITPVIGSNPEPSATTVIAARHNGSLTNYSFGLVGIIYNVSIRDETGNAVNYYSIDDNGDSIADDLGGAPATVVNGVPTDWALYTYGNGEWNK